MSECAFHYVKSKPSFLTLSAKSGPCAQCKTTDELSCYLCQFCYKWKCDACLGKSKAWGWVPEPKCTLCRDGTIKTAPFSMARVDYEAWREASKTRPVNNIGVCGKCEKDKAKAVLYCYVKGVRPNGATIRCAGCHDELCPEHEVHDCAGADGAPSTGAGAGGGGAPSAGADAEPEPAEAQSAKPTAKKARLDA
jgi:hypothetical protein